MVLKINFELPLLKNNKICFNNRIKYRNLSRYLFPVFISLSLFFSCYCTVKIVSDICKISNIKNRLDANTAIQNKLAEQLGADAKLLESMLDYKVNQLPSIEILALLHECIKDCGGISVSSVFADTYGMNLRGSYTDSSQLDKFTDRLEKSPLIASVATPVIKDSEADNRAVFTLYIKLNSMRYVIENDTSLKKAAR